MFKRILSSTVIICFFLTTLGPLPKAHADSVLDLPAPGTMVNLSPAYQPVMIKGLTVHKDNPFLFDFIVDVGQDRMSGQPLKNEGEKLIRYFLASLAIPDKDVWVNLSPYEKNKMIPDALGQTDMGRDLLEQDYILKQITASLIYPEKQLGKTFWNKVYAQVQEKYGAAQVPVNTFNKVWIMADRAEVFEHNQTAFVVDSHLKVMLEEDYLALQKHSANSSSVIATEAKQSLNAHNIASNIIRQIILPQLEKEVNTGKNFANLRQIFNSVILASWYKRSLKEALLNQVYADRSKVKGINLNDPNVKQQIYEQYLMAYKRGVFNYIKEDINAANGQMIPKKYFSGGINEAAAADPAMTQDPALLAGSFNGDPLVDFATLASTGPIRLQEVHATKMPNEVPVHVHTFTIPGRFPQSSPDESYRAKSVVFAMPIEVFLRQGFNVTLRGKKTYHISARAGLRLVFQGIELNGRIDDDWSLTKEQLIRTDTISKLSKNPRVDLEFEINPGGVIECKVSNYYFDPIVISSDAAMAVKLSVKIAKYIKTLMPKEYRSVFVFTNEDNKLLIRAPMWGGALFNQVQIVSVELKGDIIEFKFMNREAGKDYVTFSYPFDVLLSDSGWGDVQERIKEAFEKYTLPRVIVNLGPHLEWYKKRERIKAAAVKAWVDRISGQIEGYIKTLIPAEYLGYFSFVHEGHTLLVNTLYERERRIFRAEPEDGGEISFFFAVRANLLVYSIDDLTNDSGWRKAQQKIKDAFEEDSLIHILSGLREEQERHEQEQRLIGREHAARKAWGGEDAAMTISEILSDFKSTVNYRNSIRHLGTYENIKVFYLGNDRDIAIKDELLQRMANENGLLLATAAPKKNKKPEHIRHGVVLESLLGKEDQVLAWLDGEISKVGVQPDDMAMTVKRTVVAMGSLLVAASSLPMANYLEHIHLLGQSSKIAFLGIFAIGSLVLFSRSINDSAERDKQATMAREEERKRQRTQYEERVSEQKRIETEAIVDYESIINKYIELRDSGLEEKDPVVEGVVQHLVAQTDDLYEKLIDDSEGANSHIRKILFDALNKVNRLQYYTVLEEQISKRFYREELDEEGLFREAVHVYLTKHNNDAQDANAETRAALDHLIATAISYNEGFHNGIFSAPKIYIGLKSTLFDVLNQENALALRQPILDAIQAALPRTFMQFMLWKMAKNSDRAMMEKVDHALLVNNKQWERGGIDLNTVNGMQWRVSKDDGRGVEMDVDPALIARVRREGVESLSAVVFRITPIVSIWPLVGLQAPVK